MVGSATVEVLRAEEELRILNEFRAQAEDNADELGRQLEREAERAAARAAKQDELEHDWKRMIDNA